MARISKDTLASAMSLIALAVSISALSTAARAEAAKGVMPMPLIDPAPTTSGLQTADFAGGCFWGVQAVFEHVNGVTKAVSGYAGGSVKDPKYEQVSTGTTGHTESVRVTYDPSRVSYGKLLQIFFSVSLDPTQVNRQGPDVGTQYRSELFVSDPLQEQVAKAYVQQLDAAHIFNAPIATRVDPAVMFYPAEAYHQDYLDLHPTEPYIVANDMPLVKNLEVFFPAVWHSAATHVGDGTTTN